MTAPDPRNPLAGRYIDGVWTCAYCGAELLGEKVFHRPECQFKDDPVTAPDPATAAIAHVLSAVEGEYTDTEFLVAEDVLHALKPHIHGLVAEAVGAERERMTSAVLGLHKVERGGEYCQEDGFRWPCATARSVADLGGDT